MALDFNKIPELVNSTPITTQTETGSTGATSNTPIDFTSTQDAKKNNNEITDYINSEEFKALPPEEQNKNLQERFPALKNCTPEELQQHIAIARQTVENNKTSETTTSAETEPEVDSEKLSTIEKYAQETGFKGTIDELIAKLKNDEKKGTLDTKGKELLDSYRTETETQTKKVYTFKTDNYTPEDLRNMSTEEKIHYSMNKHLMLNDNNYQKLTDEEKHEYRQQQLETLAGLSDNKKTLKEMTSMERDVAFTKMEGTLKILSDQKVSITDFAKMTPEDRHELVHKFGFEKLDQLQDAARKTPGYENMSPDEKLYTYTKIFCETKYPDEYKNAPNKEEFIRNKMHSMAEEFIHSTGEKSGLAKDELLVSAANAIQNFDNNNIKISDYLKKTDIEKLQFQLSSDNELATTNNILLEECATRYKVKNPTVEQMIEMLESKPNLSENEKKLLQAYKYQSMISSDKCQAQKIVNIEFMAQCNGYTVEEYVNNKVIKEWSDDDIAKLLPRLTRENYDIVTALLDKSGRPYQKLSIQERAGILTQEAAINLAENNGLDTAEHIKYCKENGLTTVALNATRLIPEAFKDNDEQRQIAEIGITNTADKELTQALTEGLHSALPPQKVEKDAMALATSDEVCDAGKAIFAQSVVETAPSDKIKVSLGKALSTVKNAAVTEGLAAASRSVNSAAARREYNNYIDTAIKNYPPEQQAAIRTARETGKISQQTLADTTPPSESSYKTSGNKKAAESSKQPNNVAEHQAQTSGNSSTPQRAGNNNLPNSGTTATAPSAMPSATSPSNASATPSYITPRAEGRTTVSTSPDATASSSTVKPSATSEVSANNRNTTDISTQTQTQVSQQEVLELQQKAEVLMNKIEEFQKAQAASIQQWEETRAQKNQPTTELSPEEVTEIAIDAESYENLELTEDEKTVVKKIIKEMFQKNSISGAYSELGKIFGESGKKIFLQVFAAKGNSADIRAFANEYKNSPEIISILYQYSQDSSLIPYLPKDEIRNLLIQGKINDLSKVDPDILSDFISDRMKTERNPQDLKRYLAYLPLEYQGAIMNTYPDLAQEIPGSDAWLKRNRAVKTEPTTTPVAAKNNNPLYDKEDSVLFADNTPTLGDGLPLGSNQLPNPRGKERYDKRKRTGHVYFA